MGVSSSSLIKLREAARGMGGGLRRKRTASGGGVESNGVGPTAAKGNGAATDDQNPSKGTTKLRWSLLPNRAKERAVCGYEVCETLGSGGFSKVKLGRCLKTGQVVALKVIDQTGTNLQEFLVEVEAMQRVDDHDHILKLLYSEQEVSWGRKYMGNKTVMLLVLEEAPYGSLFDLITNNGPIPEAITWRLFQQTVSALAYCHSKGVYHRDVKPENVLLTEGYMAKLADFGLASVQDDLSKPIRGRVGTPSYRAPEVWTNQRYDGSKSDCWAAGVMLFNLLTATKPFTVAEQGDYAFQLLDDGCYEDYWGHIMGGDMHLLSDGARGLLTSIFHTDPETRPSMGELMDDPWMMTDLVKEEIEKEEAEEREGRSRLMFRRKSTLGTGAPISPSSSFIRRTSTPPSVPNLVDNTGVSSVLLLRDHKWRHDPSALSSRRYSLPFSSQDMSSKSKELLCFHSGALSSFRSDASE